MNDSDRLVNPLNTMISSPFQANVYSPQFGHGRVSPPQPFNCYLGNCPLDRDLFEPHEEDEHPVISPAAIEKCQAFLTEINTLLESQTAPLKPISTDTREQVFEIGSRFQLTLKKESGSAKTYILSRKLPWYTGQWLPESLKSLLALGQHEQLEIRVSEGTPKICFESQSLLSSQSACDLEDRHPSPALILDQYPALLTAVNAFIHVNIPENQMLKMNL